MEKSILAFVILGFCLILVDSQGNVNVPNRPSFGTPPPPPPPPPPPSPSPPPPSYSPPPPPPPQMPVAPPHQTPPRSPPRTLTPRQPQTPSHPPSPKPPSHHPNPPPQPKNNGTLPSKTNYNVQKKPRREPDTLGKKIGLLFVGIAGVMQICVVIFLGLKRHQLFKTKDRYETCS